MRNLIRSRWLRSGVASLCLAAAALLFLCQSSRAQIVLTSGGSSAALQSALVSGATNIALQFTDVIYTTAPLEIVEDTTLDGTSNGPVISGSNVSQIFFVDPGVHFTMINVTLSGGNNVGQAGAVGTTGGNGGNTGGNGGNGTNGTNALGGAVYNQGNCTFLTCLFATNAATGGAGGPGGNGGNGNNTGGRGGNGGNGGLGYGGAIYNETNGTIMMSNCTVAGNTANGGAGGMGGTNGSGSAFPSYPGAGGAGGAGGGAGIFNFGNLTIINSTLSQNSSLGGLSQTGGGPTGSGQNGGSGANGGNVMGGGIANLGSNSLLNCTFFANALTGGTGGNGGDGNTNGLSTGGTGGNGGTAAGGGIYNGPGAIIAITNCTFSGGIVTGGTNGVAGFGNFAGKNGSPGAIGGANIFNSNTAASFLLRNTILDFPTNTTSADGAITDQGNNISSDATPVFTTTNSFTNRDPKLSVTGLAGNGSTTVLTIGLSANSPAINAIYDGSAPPFDERGFPRPGQIRPDIGAFEFGVNFTNYNASGYVTLGGLPFGGVVVSAGQVSTVTGSNGFFEFSLTTNNSTTIRPNPQGYFNPSSITVTPTNSPTNLNFNATNAGIVFTNVTGTNTNTVFAPFLGIPNYATYTIQSTTNLLTNGTTWTTVVTNNYKVTNAIPFGYFTSGTNGTNFPQQYFRAINP